MIEVISLIGVSGFLTISGALLSFLNRIERRLTRIETKMGIED